MLPEEQQVNLRVNFAFDSAAIAEAEKPKLRQLCSVMEETGVQLFRIIGHTDALVGLVAVPVTTAVAVEVADLTTRTTTRWLPVTSYAAPMRGPKTQYGHL